MSGEEPVTKVVFDRMADFKFAAAYAAYSKSFDKASSAEERRRLNDIISQLSNDEISYPHFYGEVNRYLEGPEGGAQFKSTRIQGQRKRDYRREEQKIDRIKRHKK